MADPFPSTVSNSELAAAALRASKRLNQAADSARASEGKVAQDGNQVEQAEQPKRVVQRDCKRLVCPHCEWFSVTRTSRRMSVLSFESIYACNNPECGHTFVAVTEIVRTLSPSAIPDPSVNLPMSSHVRRDVLLYQVEHARTAEHVAMFAKPVTGDLFARAAPPPD